MNSIHKCNATVSAKGQVLVIWLLGLLAPLMVTAPVSGAGMWLYEQATPDLGTAAAGRAATADNAATVGGNPAGMTRLNRSELMVGLQPLYLKAKTDVEASQFGGGNSGNAGGWVPSASFNYVHSLSDDLKLGISASSYFGLGLDFDRNWAGRYYVSKAELLTFAVTPSVGYRVNDKLSVGAGVSMLYSELTQKAAINNPEAGVADGELKMEEDDIGFGFNLGVLLEPVDGTRFGITYRSKISLEYNDLVGFKGLGPILGTIFKGNQKIDLKIDVPQTVMLSAYHDLDDRLAIVGNLGWQDWSEFGKSDITVKSASGSTKFTQDRNFDDTWHAAIGVRYRLSTPWMLMSGFAYDSSPVDDNDRTPDATLDRQLRYAFGAQYERSRDLTISAAYELVDLGDSRINQNQGPLVGELKLKMDPHWLHFFTINASWRF